MKPIKVTIDNKAAIEAALHEINGGACRHCYTSAGELISMATGADSMLAGLLFKKDFAGALWSETSGGKVANSYKYSRKATWVAIERRSTAWYLIAAGSTQVSANGGGAGVLTLTPAQDTAARAKFATQYRVAAIPE